MWNKKRRIPAPSLACPFLFLHTPFLAFLLLFRSCPFVPRSFPCFSLPARSLYMYELRLCRLRTRSHCNVLMKRHSLQDRS
ncbi:hypothetical protein HMPREF3190_00789 [Umbribacter vaginalis]|nr:hypothetical protein HMPREF3190_00789 [Coriobacteriales bacterium DNF00809]